MSDGLGRRFAKGLRKDARKLIEKGGRKSDDARIVEGARILAQAAVHLEGGPLEKRALRALQAEVRVRAQISDAMPSERREALARGIKRAVKVGVTEAQARIDAGPVSDRGQINENNVAAYLQQYRERDEAQQRFKAERAGYPVAPSQSLLDWGALMEQPSVDPLIEGVVAKRSTCVLYSVSGLGKSFIAVSIAAAVAGDHDWMGHETAHGAVLYIAAEGAAGMGQRFKAQAEAWNNGAGFQRLDVLPRAVDLTSSDDVDDLTKLVASRRYALVVFDTMNRVAGEADENSSTAMAIVMNAVESIKAAGGDTAALIIHHSGKSGDMRGSTAIFAAADTVLELTGEQTLLKLDAVKQKDTAGGVVGHFRLSPRPELGTLLLEGVAPGSATVEGEQRSQAEVALGHFAETFPNGTTRTQAVATIGEAMSVSRPSMQRYIGLLIREGRLTESKVAGSNQLSMRRPPTLL